MWSARLSAWLSVESPPFTKNEPMIDATMPMKAIANGNIKQRQHEVVAGLLGGDRERERGQRDRGDDRSGIRLEQVGAHAGDVADVVAHVVGDGGRVARVVLGDAGFDLADEVGADVGSLGVDAAADAGEQCDRRRTEAVGREDLEGLVDLHPHDEHEVGERQTEQRETGHRESHDGAAAERDRQRLAGAGLGGLGRSRVRDRRHVHAGVARGGRQHRTEQVGDRGQRVDHDGQQQHHRDDEDGDPGVLLLEERPGAVADLVHEIHHAFVAG